MNFLQSYKFAASVALIFAGTVAFAQNKSSIVDQAQTQTTPGGIVSKNWMPSLVKDGVYDRVPHVNVALQWQDPREVDILWKKRVWREIDTREKQNYAFRFPGDEASGGGYFIEILLDAIKKGKAKAYSPFDDRFTQALTIDQINQILYKKPDTIPQVDPITGETTLVIKQREFNPESVTKYRIKEDYIFDRNLGRMVVRIIGMAPLVDVRNDDGTLRGSQPMFWLYYPELRPILAQYEVVNPYNDVDRITWDDFFEDNRFESYIIKVSNPFDESFKEKGYNNMEALYEGQREAEKLFDKESDMWVY